MDLIFKEGTVYLQGAKFGKKTWRKLWMVLFKPSSTGVGRLELHAVTDNSAISEQKKVGRQKTPERKVVRLSDCLSVTPAPKESCPAKCTAFYISTTQCIYTLASTTSEEWLSALCLLAFKKDPEESDKGGFKRGNGLTMEDNDLYSSWKADQTPHQNQYQVSIQATEASRRCQLAGEYLVCPEEEAMILKAVDTGHIIYSWPYKLLRKFGQVEGGFSIEAGRRCESGEGVFIFLSRHGYDIFQAILKQCSVARRRSIQPLAVHRPSLCDLSAAAPVTTAAASPVYSLADVPADTDDQSANHYSTINAAAPHAQRLSLFKPYLYDSKERVGEDDDDDDDNNDNEEERCRSLDAENQDLADSIYYNIRRATPPVTRKDQFEPKMDDCIYSDLKLVDFPVNPQPQPFSPPLPQLAPQPPPCTATQPVSYPTPKPRYQRQPPVNNYTQPVYSVQAQAADDMKEMEEASAHVNPSEPPGSFKQRLAEIISKDLAKFQPPLPSGAGSPTFSQ